MSSNFFNKPAWLWRVVWLAGAVVLLWAVAWLAVPPLLKSQLQKIGSEQLGRNLSVGQIDFRPWTLELTLRDLAVATSDGTSAQFAVKRLYIDVELESLLRLAPVAETLAIDSPYLKLTHLGGGRYDIDDVLARLQKPPTDQPDEPLRFALFNLTLGGGALAFDDRAVNKTHQLNGLSISVPFLSNLESRREVTVEPRLAFNFNGSRFESTALTTPFAGTRKTDATISLRAFDLAPYLAYVPASLPLRLQQAVLSADLKLAFEQADKPAVKLSGGVEVTGLTVADAQGQDLLALDRLKLALDDLRPLEQVAKIALVEISGASLTARRDPSGRLNLLLARPAVDAAGVAPSRAATASAGPNPPADSSEWKVELARFSLQEGMATWTDAAVSPAAGVVAKEVAFNANSITWPLIRPLEFSGSMLVSGNAPITSTSRAAAKAVGSGTTRLPEPAAETARLAFSGTATDQIANVKVSLNDVPLRLAAPYLGQFLEPSVEGNLKSEFELNWKAPTLQVALTSLTLDDLALVSDAPNGKTRLASIKQVKVSQAQIDLAKRSVSMAKLGIEQPKFVLARGELKGWMFERWLRTSLPAPPGAMGVPGAQAQTPWNVAMDDLSINAGNVSFEDLGASKPVAFDLLALNLSMKNVRRDGRRPEPWQLSAQIRSAQGQTGILDLRGTLQMQPLAAQGVVLATRIPMHVFEPYFGAGLNIELLRADASFKGEVRYADGASGPQIKVSGDGALEDFRANSVAVRGSGLPAAEELLRWQALGVRGLELGMAPGAATTLTVLETTLSDFFARVIIHEDGRINLQNLVKSAEGAEAAAPAAGASAPAPAMATASSAGTGVPAKNAVVAQSGAPDAVISMGPVSLINGKVYFSDRFVKPNYSANLSEMTGKLSAFSSVAPLGQPQLADLELRGRAEGTAALEVRGKLNPLAQPLALDIKGIVRDLELPPMSPYSVKYAGHGIERGKLSVDVAYVVLPNGQLTASNKLVLNQLTFGDKVEGAPNSLPVKLAVALLADRNGVIDIDLPISGSLNDPQFSLGPIIFKVIVNLIVKAITAPFSLLAGAFGGGGDELGVVAFAPGSAALTTESRQSLDKVAQALTERPALKMTVIGTASLEVEREAYKRARLQSLLQAEKRRTLVVSGSAAATQQAAAPTSITEAEIPALLKELYKRADITKPRNVAGLATDIEAPEMEALLMANIAATEDAMRELALQRGVAVKDYLGSRQLPVERLFLGAVKPAAADAKWSPRAELSLTSN